ncbi:hypothetical protein EV424DRAFT_1649952 [Suillus variegatus]|nr:hypothetical protein EV424DRAFT_1649952 [Suillus variegatus]
MRELQGTSAGDTETQASLCLPVLSRPTHTSQGSAGLAPGNDEDLDQAIALQREALALRPLSFHFHHRGNDEDLDQVITLHWEPLALRPVSHTDWYMSLNNLANKLSSHFEHRGKDEDLDQAIVLQMEALALLSH